MPNLNHYTGCGHLASQPEMRVSKAGNSVTNFTVGISYSVKVGDNWEKKVEWARGVVFGKQAEWLAEAGKGDLCIFEGRLQTRKWQDQQGQDRYTTEVICNSAQAVKKKQEDAAQESFNDGTVSGDFESEEILF